MRLPIGGMCVFANFALGLVTLRVPCYNAPNLVTKCSGGAVNTPERGQLESAVDRVNYTNCHYCAHWPYLVSGRFAFPRPKEIRVMSNILEDVKQVEVQLSDETVELIQATNEYGAAVDALALAGDDNRTAEWKQAKLFCEGAWARVKVARKAVGYD